MKTLLPVERRIRHALRGPCATAPRWREHSAMVRRAVMIVQVFYAISAARLYEASRSLSHLSGSVEGYDLLWPVLWLKLVPLETGGWIMAHLALLSGILGIVLWRHRLVRVLVSLSFLQIAALHNSHGAMSHGYHEWIWISVCFWFLPTAPTQKILTDRLQRTEFLYAFGFAPALILFFYTLSGLYKCMHAGLMLVQGEFGGFSPSAMAVTLAWRALETASSPMWAEPVIMFPFLGWPIFLGLYFVEVVSIAVFFRPVLHRTWGMLLIGFHFGTLLFMDITFSQHILINALLFVMSPFAPKETDWRAVLAAVPMVGWLFRRGLGWSVRPVGVSSRAARG